MLQRDLATWLSGRARFLNNFVTSTDSPANQRQNHLIHNTMKHISSAKALILVICSISLASVATAAKYTREIDREFNASDFERLAVHVGAGRIEASGANTDKILLNVVLEVKASSQSKADSMFENGEVVFDESAEELSVKIKATRSKGFLFRFPRYSIKADVTVVVPKNYNLKLDTGSGGIDLEDINGKIVLDTGSGSISGAGISGEINADTGSGSIKLRDISGSLNADTGSGSINAEGNIHKFSADTGSGSVRIRTLGEITEKSSADTGSGSVLIELPAAAAFNLEASVGSGKIECGFPMLVSVQKKDKLHADINGGGALIECDTGSGGVSVQPIR